MSAPAETRIVTITIARPADEVYDYVAAVENFPAWSEFIRAVKPDGAEWIFTTTHSEARARFAPRNHFGVVDHYVTPPQGPVVYVPLRVVANGPSHSEVMFTVFRQPGMSDADYDADLALVRQDLAGLQRVLEKKPARG